MRQSLSWFGRTAVLIAVLLASMSEISSAAPRGGGGGFRGGGVYRGGGGYRGGYYGGYGRGYGGYGGWGGVGLGLYGGYYGYPYGGYYDYPSTYSQPYYYTAPQVPSVAPATIQQTGIASITVRVPDPNATVLIDGAQTSTTGAVREFQTPPLQPGDYTYQITATWMENGKPVTKTEQVHVAPGAQSVVTFSPG
jgi:uncharacterized protein (TIGR03000 family)